MLARIIAIAADRLAQDPCIPAETREAFRQTAVCVFEGAVVDLVGGDSWRTAGHSMRGWVIAPSSRKARRGRILTALAAGEPASSVAQREHVSARWVRALRSKT